MFSFGTHSFFALLIAIIKDGLSRGLPQELAAIVISLA